MEVEDKSEFWKMMVDTGGVTLQQLSQGINSCGVTFSIWERKDARGGGSGSMDWTSLMGDEKKEIASTLPFKLDATCDAIQPDSASTVIKLWKVLFASGNFGNLGQQRITNYCCCRTFQTYTLSRFHHVIQK